MSQNKHRFLRLEYFRDIKRKREIFLTQAKSMSPVYRTNPLPINFHQKRKSSNQLSPSKKKTKMITFIKKEKKAYDKIHLLKENLDLNCLKLQKKNKEHANKFLNSKLSPSNHYFLNFKMTDMQKKITSSKNFFIRNKDNTKKDKHLKSVKRFLTMYRQSTETHTNLFTECLKRMPTDTNYINENILKKPNRKLKRVHVNSTKSTRKNLNRHRLKQFKTEKQVNYRLMLKEVLKEGCKIKIN